MSAADRVAAELADELVDALVSSYEDRLLSVMPCRCRLCGLRFTGIGMFAAHRVSLRCLTPIDLAEVGYQPNEHGRWGKPEVAS